MAPDGFGRVASAPEDDVNIAAAAARAGAEVVRAGFSQTIATELKGAVDPVTRVDREAEDAIRAVIAGRFPDDRILGEEGGGAGWRDGRVWIVDPLDGTVNYVHGAPHVAVSVALWGDGEPLAAVVIDVARNEEFVAAAGRGAALNGDPIRVSGAASLQGALVATGFPYDRQQHAAAYLAVVEAVMTKARGTRRMGAAALDLAWVAAGRFDAYWEHAGASGVQPWDVAAGLLLVTEAGGRFTDNAGRENVLEGSAFVAGAGKIHEELREIVAATMPDHLI